MTARDRLASIRSSWWAGLPPSAFILDRDDRPLGVMDLSWCQEMRYVRVPIRHDFFANFAFDLAFPDEPPSPELRSVELERHPYRDSIFWRLSGGDERDLERIDGFYPTLKPLPGYAFVAELARAQLFQSWLGLGAEMARRSAKRSG